MPIVEYPAGAPFPGVIGRTADESAQRGPPDEGVLFCQGTAAGGYFEPTGVPDMPHGKGVPARLQLYSDGALLASADAPYTTPFMFNPTASAAATTRDRP